MPIKFRCPHCRQFLGISRSKAGEIADCPMCGKTLRVPNLDGTIKPLPKPKLNLQDSSLVNALGELASIGSASQSDQTREADSPRAAKQSQTPAPSSAPKPITLAPLLPAEPVAVAPERETPKKHTPRPQTPQETTASLSEDEATIDDPALGIPAANGRETFLPEPVAAAAASRGWVPVAVAVGLFLLAGVGLLIMMNGARPVDASAAEQNADGVAAAGTAAPAGDTTAAITGRITYVSEAGDSRPDDGAKVIALPAERRGTVMLDATGFMVGSAEVDAQVAAAAIRALGGDLVTADERGEYALHLSEAGPYKLLVISRHQSRSWEIGVEADVQDLLARFFIRPSTLLGQLAYDVQEMQYRGQGTSPRDVAFKRD